MAEHGRVRFGDATIEYEVHRSQRRRKTVQITMDGGRVLVAAPTDTPGSKLETIVHKRAPWILRQVPDPLVAPSKKRFVSGETLPYLGRNVRLIVEPGDVPSPRVRFDHWSFRIDVPAQLDDADRYDGIRKVVTHWYRRRAELRLPEAVEIWRKRIGLPETPEVLIRDQRQRWGSCAPGGTLRFNWRRRNAGTSPDRVRCGPRISPHESKQPFEPILGFGFHSASGRSATTPTVPGGRQVTTFVETPGGVSLVTQPMRP